METRAKSPAIIQLLAALQEEGIRYLLVGMSAANLQGVLATTIDVDVWIGLPSRQYIRVSNICRRLNAAVRSANKVYLDDDTPVDFIYEVGGLHSFAREYAKAKWLTFHGLRVPVLSLERICRSKQVVGRDKDKLHVLLIRQALRAQRATRAKRRPLARRNVKTMRLKRRVSHGK